MEAIYYWTGFVIVWLIMMPVASVCAIMGLVWLHKKSMEAFFWYRVGMDLQILPLYVRLALTKGEASKRFIANINKKKYPKNAHLRVLVGFLNYLHSLRKTPENGN